MSKIKAAAYNISKGVTVFEPPLLNRTEVFFVKVVVIKPPKILSRVIKKAFRIGK